MVSGVREQMVSQRRSTTFSKVANTSFRKPRLRISFQICSIGFISGVYGGIWKSTIFSGTSSVPDLCHAAPSQHNRMVSCGNCLDNSRRNRFIQYCNRAWQENRIHRSAAQPHHRHIGIPEYGGMERWGGCLSRTSSILAC